MSQKPRDQESSPSLPDYLAPGLRLVFVGINPGLYSAQVGHYFASPRNRFWRAFNLAGLATGEFGPEQDQLLLQQGIGFTDMVKRPTSGAGDLKSGDFRTGAPLLKEKLLRFHPRVICFHGVTAYGNYLRYAEGIRGSPKVGAQPRAIGQARVFVTPNPSPANAAVSLDTLVAWYTQLKALVEVVAGDE